MSDNPIAELEAAANIIMATPNLVTNAQRKNAELVFLNFRKCKLPYTMCKTMLDNSKVDYVLFEAAETIKNALIREWTFLLDSDKMSLRQYLMNYITTRQVSPFIRDKLLQIIAIMVKRSSVDDNGRELIAVFREIEAIVVNSETDKKIFGFNLIYNILQEYATTVKSTDIGLSWEVHFRAKKQFEATHMKRIFQFCHQLLSQIAKNDPPYPDNILEITRHILKITDCILCWGYISPLLPKRLIGIYESVHEVDQAPSLRLSNEWENIIIKSDIVPLMFQIFWKFRDYEVLTHHSLSCLVQLASLNGTIVECESNRIMYINDYLENFNKLLSGCIIKNKESLGISTIIKKLVLFFVNDIQNTFYKSAQETFLEELTRLTCSFLRGSILNDIPPNEDNLFNEALDNMMEAWAGIMQEFNVFSPDQKLQECAVNIFNAYLQYHLAPPEGERQSFSNDNCLEIEDDEDGDRTSFKDQLQTLGMFGRTVPSHSLPLLFKLIESRTEKLKESLQLLKNRAMNITESVTLDNLFEDIHWIILISGHVLAMDSSGETPMIPSEIMFYSREQNKEKNSTLEASLKVLASVRQINNNISLEDLHVCDHVIRIASDVMKLCTVECSAAEVKLGHFLSPEVSTTLMWFLKRWCISYLLPSEHYYHEVSTILFTALGEDTESAVFIVEFVLDKVYSNILYFNSEPILLRDTVDLLTQLVCLKQKQTTCIVKNKSLWNIICLQEQLAPGRLPTNIRRDLLKSFTLAGVALQHSSDDLNVYFEQILKPIETRFKNIITNDNFRTNYQNEQIQKEIIDLLECFIGVAQGCYMATATKLINFLIPILYDMRLLLDLFHNYQLIVQMILDLFGQCAKNMLCYLHFNDSKKLYECSLVAIETYAKCNSNKFSQESLAEENSFQDIVLILDLLTYLLSKDCIDLCPEDQEPAIAASDVTLVGLNFILPLMNMELLKYPDLCLKFYRLLVLVNDIYPEKICNLPNNMLQQLLRLIEIGLTQFSSDVVQASLDFVQGITTHFFRHSLKNSQQCQAMKPFVKLLLDLTLSQKINSDLISSASTCIYSLICCYEDEYNMLVNFLTNSQTDPLISDRLSAAFHNLTLNIAFNGERLAKLKFRDNFDKFIANVHGFLFVK